MSETDSFIEEVSEEVRRDRLFSLFRKYGWIPALAVVVIVGGAAWVEWRRAEANAAAESLGDAILSAVVIDDAKARAAALEELTGSSPGSDAALQLIAAAALLESGDPVAADAKLATVVGDPAVPELYRDLADLKRLTLSGGGMTGAERSATIDRLARPGGAFRTLALEQRGLALAEAGDTAGALKIFTDLMQDAEATPALSQRVRQLILAYGGTLDAG